MSDYAKSELLGHQAESIADRIDSQMMQDLYGSARYVPSGDFYVKTGDAVLDVLVEIRDTLQGRRGFIAIPSAAECARFGRKKKD